MPNRVFFVSAVACLLLTTCITGQGSLSRGKPQGSAVKGADSRSTGATQRRRAGRSNSVVECSSRSDCPSHQKCIKPKGALSNKGVCGKIVDDMGMPKITLDEETGNCSFDADCPLFFKCHQLNALEGVCGAGARIAN